MPIALKDEVNATCTYSKYVSGNGRIASSDIEHLNKDSIAHQRLDIVTTSMTTGKPAGDGYINTFSWDTNQGWDTQFYIPNNDGSANNGGRPQLRFLKNTSTWSSWISLALKTDIKDATLTIQKNGSSIGTFTSNASSNATINVVVPTKTSDITNDSGYITASDDITGNAATATNATNDANGDQIDATYLKLSGGTMTGKLASPYTETGTGSDSYFQTRRFRGQGNAADYHHAIDFGYASHDRVDWYEYGAVWNFWKNTTATATTDTANLALGITLNALKNKSYTYTFPNKTGTFALTSDIPSIPTVNDATLTIKNNGTTVDTFTANSSTDTIVDIIPKTLYMNDSRTSLVPSDATNYNMTAFFSTEGALDSQSSDNKYCDVIVLSGWKDTSGGRVNAIAATKTNQQALYHYTGTYGASTWSGKKPIAYADDIDDTYFKKSGGEITGAITRTLASSGTIATTNLFTLKGSTDGFMVDYASTTADLGITTLYSIDDANAKISIGNKVGSTYKEAISITNGSATINGNLTGNVTGDVTGNVSGNAGTATALETARTIGLGTGATGTATSFDGSANITIPVTDMKESYVTWGGMSRKDGDLTPSTMGCLDEFGHNRLAFLPASCLRVAFTRDGGTTWLDYTTANGADFTPSDADKINFMTRENKWFTCGGRLVNGTTAANEQLRIRLAAWKNTSSSSIYMAIKQIVLNVTTEGAGGTKVRIRHRTIQQFIDGNESSWVDDGTYDIGGWSGWNSIPFIHRFGGGTSQKSQEGEIEFLFTQTSVNSSSKKNLRVGSLRVISSNIWTSPSTMASTGHLYTFDTGQNATFPGKITSGDITAYNLFNRDTSGNYGKIGNTSNPWNSIYLSDGLYNGSVHLNLPSTTGTLALESDIPVITVTNTDPGEGVSLQENHFIAVYTS